MFFFWLVSLGALFFKNKFIYLAAWDLSCGMQELLLPCMGFLGVHWLSYCEACGTQFPESEVAQSCLTLCNPMDCSLPGSSVRGIFQARILEWVAISFSRRSFQPRDQTQTLYHLSHQGSLTILQTQYSSETSLPRV